MTKLFFDLDGTITNSREGIFNSIKYALNKLNLPMLDDETLTKFIGPSLMYSFQNYANLDEATAKKAVQTYREYYQAGGLFENELYDGVEEMLAQLSADCQLYIATSKPEIFAKKIITHFDLDQYFTGIYGAALDESRNTKAKVIKYGLTELALSDTDEVIMVGDRETDITGAQENNLKGVGVTYGFGSRAELAATNPLAIIDHPLELVEVIQNR